MKLKTVEITELKGVNRNAVEGVTQMQPIALSGFDLSRTGGYYAAYGKESTSVVSSVSGSVLAYDDYGVSYFDTRKLLFNGTLYDVSSASLNEKTVYLLPLVGLISHMEAEGTDQYDMGGYFQNTDSELGDLYRVSGESVTATGAGSLTGNIKTISLYFAPTAQGLTVYDTNYATVSASSSRYITVSGNKTLPAGYGVRAYIADSDDVTFKQYLGTGENDSLVVFSDGGSNLTARVDTSGSMSETTNAVINFNDDVANTEPHLQRVWGRAGSPTFVGPYATGYAPEKYATWTTNQLSTRGNTDGPAFDTPDSATLDGLSTALSTVTRFSEGLRFDKVDSTTKGSSSFEMFYYLLYRKGAASDPQFATGIRCLVDTVDLGAGYLQGRVRIYWHVNVDGVTTNSSLIQTEYTVGSAGGSTPAIWANQNVQARVDLTAETANFRRLDKDGNTLENTSFSLSAGTPSTLPAGGALDAWYFTAPDDGVTGVSFMAVRISAFEQELHDNATASSEIATLDFDDYTGASTITSSATSEVWTIQEDVSVVGGPPGLTAYLDTTRTLVYSDIGYSNFASSYEQWVKLGLTTSTQITALRSTPAGLIAFADNEAFLVRGDPANASSFAVQRFSGTLGCDAGVTPARLGGTIFPIWKGRLFSMSLGMGDVDFGSGLADIGGDVFSPEDPFVQVVGEPRSRHVIARTESGRVYRFSTEHQAWMNSVYDNESGLTYLLPNADSFGTRYYIDSNLDTVNATPSAPSASWEDVDLGDKNRMKMWRRVYLQTNDDYSGTPTLGYVIDNTSGTVTGSDETGGRFSFTFPSGLVNEKAESLTLTLNGAVANDTIEPNVTVEFVERYRRR